MIWPPGTPATTPAARPPSSTIRRTSDRSRISAPFAQAAASVVRSEDCLAPVRQPTAHGPQSVQPRTPRGITACGSPSASSPAASFAFGPLWSLSALVTLISASMAA